ncbi:hypothetical protein HNY73_007692 [Argiope bruennichi]|uniref:Uncharacterized protein n=1 Tax=Argiope bruennichi TaxID=94029 RepID=A0A8T0FJR8_ARGBR|nr:hypothetical protein HNY73_007692 [Argiope bruennichi]
MVSATLLKRIWSVCYCKSKTLLVRLCQDVASKSRVGSTEEAHDPEIGDRAAVLLVAALQRSDERDDRSRSTYSYKVSQNDGQSDESGKQT